MDILRPLVRQSIDAPSDSWSHERCIIRMASILVEHGHLKKKKDHHEDAHKLLLEVQSAYNAVGIKLQSVSRNTLLKNEPLQVCLYRKSFLS